VLRLDSKGQRFVLGESCSRPDSLQENEPELLTECFLDDLAIAPASSSGSNTNRTKNPFV
jgi:hypothetical protein